MESPKKPALKSCPFCGGTIVGVIDRYPWFVMCGICGAKGSDQSDSEEEAIKAWNTRQ